jgi:predicted DNA-binding transcriptional regulator AlpA
LRNRCAQKSCLKLTSKSIEYVLLTLFGGKQMSDTQVKSQTCQLLSAQAVGKMLSLSKRQIFRLNSCGKIPAPIRIGGAVRWAESTISRWLQDGAPDRATFEAMQEAGK